LSNKELIVASVVAVDLALLQLLLLLAAPAAFIDVSDGASGNSDPTLVVVAAA
jgi:hypothetical protein